MRDSRVSRNIPHTCGENDPQEYDAYTRGLENERRPECEQSKETEAGVHN